jgi:hypothetical protein
MGYTMGWRQHLSLRRLQGHHQSKLVRRRPNPENWRNIYENDRREIFLSLGCLSSLPALTNHCWQRPNANNFHAKRAMQGESTHVWYQDSTECLSKIYGSNRRGTGRSAMFFRLHRHPVFNTKTYLSTTMRSSSIASRKEFTSEQRQMSIFQNICSLSETRNQCTRITIRSTQRYR